MDAYWLIVDTIILNLVFVNMYLLLGFFILNIVKMKYFSYSINYILFLKILATVHLRTFDLGLHDLFNYSLKKKNTINLVTLSLS